MKTLNLEGTLRNESGKKSSLNLRATGWIPCELYGINGNTHFSVYYADFKPLVYSPDTFRVTLNIDGKKSDAIMREIQFHPLSDDITHVDFMEIDESKAFRINLPINFTGVSIGVKEGGKLVKKLRKLSVKGFAKDMPDVIDVDISHLALGKSIKVSDVKVTNLEIINAMSNPVATIDVPRGVKDAAAAAAAATPGKK
ncbi:MAG: 50S ribosomal protein L25 [Bacteroidetes bacterium]|nr:50S ribosomal protein L25 [Bacteroidota bacterium]